MSEESCNLPLGAMRVVRDTTARLFGVEPYALSGRSRMKSIVRARHAACWVIKRRWPKATYPYIATRFGGRDHSTIINSVRKAEVLRRECSAFRMATDALVEMEIGAAVLIPKDVAEEITRLAAEEAARAQPSETVRYLEFIREVMSYPEPKLGSLNIQLKGHGGCPGLSACEIERRREQVETCRRAREIALLEAERVRYRLPKRGRALSEMVL